MKFSAIVAAASALVSVSAGASPVKTNSPTNVRYVAHLKKYGSVAFYSTNGSVTVDVDISNLPTSGGPFLYHVHQRVVPTNGNCTGTLAHFNPYNGSETATAPAEKEDGDLSGKHGTIHGTALRTTYIDPWLSLNPSDPAFFGNLSVVVHFANTTRIDCANITRAEVNSTTVNAGSALGGSVWLAGALAAGALLV